MNKFKIGDRVKVKDNYFTTYDIKGKHGTVIAKYKNDCLVKFDYFHDGGNGTMYDKDIDGTRLTGRQCLYIDNDDIEKIAPETIVIYRKDRQVIALDKATGKKSVARCNPSDEFDFNVVAKLAFDRLMDSETKDDSGLNEDAKKLYEVYKSLADVGFTLTEAMQLVVNMLLGGKK